MWNALKYYFCIALRPSEGKQFAELNIIWSEWPQFSTEDVHYEWEGDWYDHEQEIRRDDVVFQLHNSIDIFLVGEMISWTSEVHSLNPTTALLY